MDLTVYFNQTPLGSEGFHPTAPSQVQRFSFMIALEMQQSTISLPSHTNTLPTRIIIVSIILLLIGIVGLMTLHPEFIPKPTQLESDTIE